MPNTISLEALDGISFVTNPEGTITAVGASNWNAFASANGALELIDQLILGNSLFEFISGQEVQAQLKDVMKKISVGIYSRWAMPFRCDSPDRQRNMRQSITPIRASGACVGMLFQSIELHSEQRPQISLFDFREIERRAAQEPDLPTIAMCSWCQRVRQEPTSGTEWVEAEVYYAAGGSSHVRISHGICDNCFETASKY